MRKSGLTGDEAYILSKHGGTTGDLGPLKKEISLIKEDLGDIQQHVVRPENYDRLKDKTFVHGQFNASGDIVKSENTSDYKVFLMYVPVEEETAYIVSGNYFNYIGQARGYDKDKNLILNGVTVSDGRLITTATGIRYVRFSVGSACDAENIIFQKGTSATAIGNYILDGIDFAEKSVSEKMLDDSLRALIINIVNKKQFTQQVYTSSRYIEYKKDLDAMLIYFTGNISIRCGYGLWDFKLNKILEIIGDDYKYTDSQGKIYLKIPNSHILCLNIKNPSKRINVVQRDELDLDVYVPLISCVDGMPRGRGLLHQELVFVSVEEIKTKIGELDVKIKALENSKNITDYVNEESKLVVNKIKNIHTSDTLSFAFITDSHAYTTTGNFTGLYNAYNSISLISKELGHLSCCVSGGDNTTERAKKEDKYATMHVYKSLIDMLTIPKWICKGNHDDGSISDWAKDSNGTYTNKITDDEMYVEYNKNNEYGSFITNINDKSGQYSYIDFPNNAIRIYCLNSVDVTANEAGQHLFKYGENQISWVKQTLLSMPKNYNVLFITHVCPVNLNDEGFTKTGDDYVKDNSGLQMFDISKAIKNHTAINGLDMSKNTGDFIAWICGHTHKDYDAIKDGILFVSTMQSANQEEGKIGYGTAVAKDGNTYYNIPDTADETAYDIFTINPISKKIYATRYGVGTDREWTYSN